MIEYLVSGQYRDPEDDRWESFGDLVRLEGEPSTEKFATEVAKGSVAAHGPRLTASDVKITKWEVFTGDGTECLAILNWPGRAKQQRQEAQKLRERQSTGMRIPEDELIKIIQRGEREPEVIQPSEVTQPIKKKGWVSMRCNLQ
jgi:hypothetical protein